jgi:hypothetical protein
MRPVALILARDRQHHTTHQHVVASGRFAFLRITFSVSIAAHKIISTSTNLFR